MHCCGCSSSSSPSLGISIYHRIKKKKMSLGVQFSTTSLQNVGVKSFTSVGTQVLRGERPLSELGSGTCVHLPTTGQEATLARRHHDAAYLSGVAHYLNRRSGVSDMKACPRHRRGTALSQVQCGIQLRGSQGAKGQKLTFVKAQTPTQSLRKPQGHLLLVQSQNESFFWPHPEHVEVPRAKDGT